MLFIIQIIQLVLGGLGIAVFLLGIADAMFGEDTNGASELMGWGGLGMLLSITALIVYLVLYGLGVR